MATALILALIVLATGLAIGSASKEVASLESEVKFQSEQLAETDVKLSYLGDELTITGAATELGMVRPTALPKSNSSIMSTAQATRLVPARSINFVILYQRFSEVKIPV